jgi:hypothetical protein
MLKEFRGQYWTADAACTQFIAYLSPGCFYRNRSVAGDVPVACGRGFAKVGDTVYEAKGLLEAKGLQGDRCLRGLAWFGDDNAHVVTPVPLEEFAEVATPQ